jgi:hypothetical protein
MLAVKNVLLTVRAVAGWSKSCEDNEVLCSKEAGHIIQTICNSETLQIIMIDVKQVDQQVYGRELLQQTLPLRQSAQGVTF